MLQCGKLQDINQNNFLSGGYHTVLQLFCIIVKIEAEVNEEYS